MGARPPSNNPNRPTGQQPTDRMQSIRTLLNLCPLRHSSESTAVVVKVAIQAALTTKALSHASEGNAALAGLVQWRGAVFKSLRQHTADT
jgi:hypothetical protein